MNNEIPADDTDRLAEFLASAPAGSSAYVIRGGSAVGTYTPDRKVADEGLA